MFSKHGMTFHMNHLLHMKCCVLLSLKNKKETFCYRNFVCYNFEWRFKGLNVEYTLTLAYRKESLWGRLMSACTIGFCFSLTSNLYHTMGLFSAGHIDDLFVLRFYGPVNPMGSCRARSVYLTRLLGRLSPLSG